MSPQESAKVYCQAMGLDPDEKVLGKMFGEPYKLKVRWMWYLGARFEDLYRGQRVDVATRMSDGSFRVSTPTPAPFTPRLV